MVTFSTSPQVELLAPAGGPEPLVAAVNNGADAVYLGVEAFNARRGATNFTLDDLTDAVATAHRAGVRVYLTANILVFPDEMAEALATVAAAWERGVDAVIVQDLGLAAEIRRSMPDVRLHASTQIGAHSTATVDALATIGFERVTLAREVSIPAIAAIAAATPLEIEVFAHGSLCYCYSGQCSLSVMIGGRSANRGTCAQPCRLPYRLLDARGEELPTPGAYLLSPKDLASIDRLPELVAAGVGSLKIEGRMKAPEYVALVTRTYRAALDRAIADPDGYRATPAEHAVLEEAFSRGFTDGYLAGEPGPAMMSYRRPNNRGVAIGRVSAAADGWLELAPERDLVVGDRIEAWTGAGRVSAVIETIEVDGARRDRAVPGVVARVAPVGRVARGDRVFRVTSAELTEAARRTFSDGPADEPVGFTVELVVGRALVVEAHADGRTGRFVGAPVDAARTKPVTAAEVEEHVAGRLGGSGYVADGFNLTLDPGAGIGFSTLHRARREALAALDAERAGGSARHAAAAPVPVVLRQSSEAHRAAELVVFADADDRAWREAGADRVCVRQPGKGEAEAWLPRIVTDAERERWERRATAAGRAVVSEPGSLARLAAAGVRVGADVGLNAANPWTVRELAALGAAEVWLSPELDERRVAAIASVAAVPVGLLVFGRGELMVAENCVLAAAGSCDRRCGACTLRVAAHTLEDRKGYRFPVRTDEAGRSHIFNSITLDLSRALPAILDAGVTMVGVDARVVDGDPLAAVAAIRERLDDAIAGRAVDDRPLAQPATSGRFFTGVA
jgi:putative protease